jgi:hypothetical protein
MSKKEERLQQILKSKWWLYMKMGKVAKILSVNMN